MDTQWPTYLDIPSDRLGDGSGVTVRTCPDRAAVARDMADAILSEIRRMLHGPIGPDCPASFLRTHDDAGLTLAEYVAARP